jgi:K+-sensing histidine kinase KdpD
MTNTIRNRALTPAELDGCAAELDAVRARTTAKLGQADANYIRRIVKAVRYTEIAGRALLFAGAFVPAILVASFLGGAPAGTFAALITIPIVWWAFMPPHFEFNPLSAAEYDSFAVFLLVSSLVICFAHLVREALGLIRK